jgi:hypothetical protein
MVFSSASASTFVNQLSALPRIHAGHDDPRGTVSKRQQALVRSEHSDPRRAKNHGVILGADESALFVGEAEFRLVPESGWHAQYEQEA